MAGRSSKNSIQHRILCRFQWQMSLIIGIQMTCYILLGSYIGSVKQQKLVSSKNEELLRANNQLQVTLENANWKISVRTWHVNMFYLLWRHHSPATEKKVQTSWTFFHLYDWIKNLWSCAITATVLAQISYSRATFSRLMEIPINTWPSHRRWTQVQMLFCFYFCFAK